MEPSASEALAAAVERVGDRWTLQVLHGLLEGPARFGELEDRVPAISTSVLSQRLKQLEADGLILATPYQERPPRFAYELTDRGRELAGVLRLLAEWGSDRGAGEGALRHEACGTAVEARWWCPTCERIVDEETTDLHHL